MKRAFVALLGLTAALASASTEDDERRFEEARRQIQADQAKAGEEVAREEADAAAAYRAQELAEEPARLRRLGTEDLCVQYGNTMRGDDTQLQRIAEAEAKRRGLPVTRRHAKAEKVGIGDGICQVLAAWGEPQSRRRITLANRVSVTLFYGSRTMVELTNGRVTAIVN